MRRLVNEDQTQDSPDGVVATRVLHTRSITSTRDVTVDVLHEQIGRQHTMHEVSPDVCVIEVILEERRHLAPDPARVRVGV